MPKVRAYYSGATELIIDSSGQHGNEARGDLFAMDGQNGEDALDIQLSLSIKNEMLEINVLSVGSYTVPLSHPRIIVKANGGHGGNGSHGASGRNGRDGRYGDRGQNGEGGEDGGIGGPGGRGGNGGHAGNVTIIVKEKDKHIVDLLTLELHGGNPGLGGAGGPGGRGGNGGQGGSCYSWTEAYYGQTASETRYIYHNESGGFNGHDGRNGMPGQRGENGRMGNRGALKVEIEKNILESLPKNPEPILPTGDTWNYKSAQASTTTFETTYGNFPSSFGYEWNSEFTPTEPYESKSNNYEGEFHGFFSAKNEQIPIRLPASTLSDNKPVRKSEAAFDSMFKKPKSALESIFAAKDPAKDLYVTAPDSRVKVEIEGQQPGEWITLTPIIRKSELKK